MVAGRREDDASAGPFSTARPVRRRRLKRVVLLCGVFSIGVLFAAEASLRVLARYNADYAVRIGSMLEWDPYLRVRLRKNVRLGEASLNSRGFLGPEFEATKTPGSVRIVTLGDSCSFLPTEQPYPRFLEESLRGAFGSDKVDVINASCPGYHSGQARTWYEREVDAYEHDILVIYLGWNDMGYFNPEGRTYDWDSTQPAAAPPTLQRILSSSYLLRSFQYFNSYRRQGDLASLEPFTGAQAQIYYRAALPPQFSENINAIIDLAEQHGRTVFLLNHATLVNAEPTEDEQRRMHFPIGMNRSVNKFLLLIEACDSRLTEISRDRGAELIDIKSLFVTEDDRRLFTDSSHFDAEAAERIGNRVAGALRSECEAILASNR